MGDAVENPDGPRGLLSDIAARINSPKASRAVGAAVEKPISSWCPAIARSAKAAR